MTTESSTLAPLISKIAQVSHDPAVLLWISDVAPSNVASVAVGRLPAATLVEHASSLAQRFNLVPIVLRRHDEFSETEAAVFGRIAHAGWCAARSKHTLEPLQRLLSSRAGRSAFQACVTSHRDWFALSDPALLLVIQRASYHTISSLLEERQANQFTSEIRTALALRLKDSTSTPSPYAMNIIAAVMNAPPEPGVVELVRRCAPERAGGIIDAWTKRKRPIALQPTEQKLTLLHQGAVHSWLLHAASIPAMHDEVIRALNERDVRVDSHFLHRLIHHSIPGPSPLRLELLTRLGTHALGLVDVLHDASEDETATALLLAQEARFHVIPRREIEERWRALPAAARIRAARRHLPSARRTSPTRPRNAPPTMNLVMQDSEVFPSLSPAEILDLGGNMANIADAACALSAEELKVFLSVLEANFDTPLCDLFLVSRRSTC